ncbi:MAG: hypothetical protein JJT77_10920 [Crocinitomicaceae bacterium]|nr:hypothetical protein [Crocinitomicaceae bacterium]
MEEDIQERQDENKDEGQEVDKTIGVLAYLSFVGWILALVLNSSKKDEEKRFGAFHLRQGLGLFIFSIFLFVVVTVVSTVVLAATLKGSNLVSLLGYAFSALILFFILTGAWNAINGNIKKLPWIGGYIAKILKDTFE